VRADVLTSQRWTLVEDHDAARLIVWGAIGPAETDAFDARLDALGPRRVPVIIDLTRVTELDADVVAWLGARHADFGPGRPMLVAVIADGPLHQRLTRPGAPQLRLTLE